MKELNLTAYKGKDLQNAISILVQLDSIQKTMTVGGAITVLNNSISKIGSEADSKIRYREKVKSTLCPSCKKGYLLPTPNYENLNILSCKKCRYSTILEEEIENG